jgi:hypothetical protein
MERKGLGRLGLFDSASGGGRFLPLAYTYSFKTMNYLDDQTPFRLKQVNFFVSFSWKRAAVVSRPPLAGNGNDSFLPKQQKKREPLKMSRRDASQVVFAAVLRSGTHVLVIFWTLNPGTVIREPGMEKNRIRDISIVLG